MKRLQHWETSQSLIRQQSYDAPLPYPHIFPPKFYLSFKTKTWLETSERKRSPAEKWKKKEKKTIRMQMEMSGKHDKSIKPHTHTQMRCLLVVLIYNIHALYLHQSLLCNSMQHASREEEVRTWQTCFLILYNQGTKNAIVSTQTLTYTYITGSPCIFSKQFHISCILAFPMAGQ